MGVFLSQTKLHNIDMGETDTLRLKHSFRSERLRLCIPGECLSLG